MPCCPTSRTCQWDGQGLTGPWDGSSAQQTPCVTTQAGTVDPSLPPSQLPPNWLWSCRGGGGGIPATPPRPAAQGHGQTLALASAQPHTRGPVSSLLWTSVCSAVPRAAFWTPRNRKGRPLSPSHANRLWSYSARPTPLSLESTIYSLCLLSRLPAFCVRDVSVGRARPVSEMAGASVSSDSDTAGCFY